ncbi:hypothetical protein BN1723_011614, partial [Verticillium longisporum]
MAHVGLLSSRLGAAGWLSGARLSCVSASASASAITFSCGAVTHTRFSQQFSSLVTTWAPATPRSAPTGSTLPLHHELAAAARRHGEQLRPPTPPRRHCSSVTTSELAFHASSFGNMADRDVLPDAIKPSHYVVSLRELDFKNWTYQGTVRQVANHPIDVEVIKPTKEVVINALELKLSKASVTVTQNKSTESYESASISLDEKKQRAVIAFDQDIPASQKASVLIHFEGILNNDMAGFYRSKYTPAVTPAASVPRDDEWHYMLSTQFEPCDARRAFPCFDEPNLKATFDVELEIPDDQVALSNMPVKDTKKTRDGFHLVSFETSPKMSTYLLAWAIGDFEYVEAFTERRYNGKQLPVRVYTTRGLKEQGRWALWHAPRIIDYFSDIFGIEYPLPKADLLAVHEFSAGAMENWGLVTYRTTAVLYDEKTSEPRYANRVAYVVAHELAHQWFGNLVTMDWWDELWLNEGFATWVGWLATDHLHPEWQVWP